MISKITPLKKQSFAHCVQSIRQARCVIASVVLCACLAGVPSVASPQSPAPSVALLGDGSVIPAGDWRTLADLTEPSALTRNFLERGARQFVASTRAGLEWTPNATNLSTFIYAAKGRPTIVPDPAIAVEFQLPSDGSSLGLHLHGVNEAAPSHLVLVSRSATDRGLIRAYRTPIWPSVSIAGTDQLPAIPTRLTSFPAETWYRLTVTTRSDDTTGNITLSVRLTTADDSLIGTMEVTDSGQALPTSGLVALRLFAPSNGLIRVRNLLGQPQP